MSTITVSSVVIPQWQYGGTTAKLRLFLDRGFVSSAGIPLQASAPNLGSFYKDVICTISGTDLTIPSFTIDSTTDGQDIQGSRYSAYFYNSAGSKLKSYEGFASFAVGPSPATVSWADIRAFNVALQPNRDFSAYTKEQSDRRYATLGSIAGISDPGSNGILARTSLNTSINRTITGTANQVAVTDGSGVAGNPTISLTGPYAPATYTSNGVLYGAAAGAILATAQGAANSILQANGGAPVLTPTPSLDRLTMAPATPLFDLATNVMAVGVHLPLPSDQTVATGKVFAHVRISKNDGEYNVFDIGGTGVAMGIGGYLEAKATSGASSALYYVIGALSNKGPGTVKTIYGRSISQTGCTGVSIAGVFAAEAQSGSTDWIVQLSGSDNVDYAIRIHHDVALGSTANFNGGIEYQKTVRMESGGAFFRAYQTAGHDGDFLSYLSQADAVLFKVDKNGNITAANFSAGSSAWVVISSQDASNSAFIEFTSGLSSTYDRYVITLDSIKSQNDDKQLQMIIGTGGGPTYHTAAGDYSWSQTSEIAGLDVQSGNSSDTQILLTQPTGGTTALGNATGENLTGEIFFTDPDASSHFTNFSYQVSYNRATDSLAYHSMGGGFYKSATAVTAIKFLFDTGNIVSGRFTLYGISH